MEPARKIGFNGKCIDVAAPDFGLSRNHADRLPGGARCRGDAVNINSSPIPPLA